MNAPESEILVVDDERGFHDLFRFILEPMGFSVSSAYDGIEGLDLVKKRDYNTVFLDVHMPKMTGPELLSLIMKIRSFEPEHIAKSVVSGPRA